MSFSTHFILHTQAKRDALFRSKVVVKDAEDKNAEPIAVARHLILPLPRTYEEAAEWGTRYVMCKAATYSDATVDPCF